MHPVEARPGNGALERWMWLDETAPQEKRFRAVSSIEEIDRSVGDPSVVVQLVGKLGRLGEVVELAAKAVRVHDVPVSVGTQVRAEVIAWGIAGNLFGIVSTLKSPVSLAMIEMHLADAVRLIAELIQTVHKTRPLTVDINVVDTSSLVGSGAGSQGMSSRHAYRAWGVTVVEACSPSNEAVDMGRPDFRIPKSIDTVSAQLIREEEENVWTHGSHLGGIKGAKSVSSFGELTRGSSFAVRRSRN